MSFIKSFGGRRVAKVAIVMGSDSDLEIMKKAASVLDEFGIDYEMNIISAHREPEEFFNWAKGLEEKGTKVIIAGAGMAAHLPGMSAAIFPLPVIGVPLKGKALSGEDAVYSILQMPPGVPVATMAIDGAKNAGIMAAKILAVSDEGLLDKIRAFNEKQKKEVMEKNRKLQAGEY